MSKFIAYDEEKDIVLTFGSKEERDDFEKLINGLQKVVEHLEKYKWHDLRKNPDDLPKEEHEVEVIANMLCKWDKQYREFTIRMRYIRKIMYGKPIGWGVGYPYNFDFETDHVIAWREIEPFESEVDKNE